MYKAFIFDFDGVIKDSVHVKSEAFLKLYANEGEEFLSRVKRYHLENGGVSRYEKFKTWNGWLGRTNDLDYINKQAADFAKLVVQEVVQSPYVQGALESIRLAGEKGKCFVATGTPDSEIKEILKRLGLISEFDEIFGSSQKKQNIVEGILQRHRIVKTEALFIGDAKTDYHAAVLNGVDFYLRETDYNINWFEKKPGVTHRSKDLNDLAKIISLQ